MARVRGDKLTGDLLSWQPPKVEAGFEVGAIRGSRLESQISQAVGLALKGHDRAVIAQRMSEELGYPISHNMIDNYASEGQVAHKISLERFIALMEATGCVDALGFVADRLDHVVVPRKYAAIIKKSELEDHKAKLARYEQSLDTEMRGWK